MDHSIDKVDDICEKTMSLSPSRPLSIQTTTSRSSVVQYIPINNINVLFTDESLFRTESAFISSYEPSQFTTI